MISANQTSRSSGAYVTMLALTQEERTQLRAILDRVIADVRKEYEKTHFKFNEVDFQTELVAREFRRRL